MSYCDECARLQRELAEARTLEMCLRVDFETAKERADRNWEIAEEFRQRAEKAEAQLKAIAERLGVTPDSEIALLLDVRLRRYESDVNPAIAAKLRQEKRDLTQERNAARQANAKLRGVLKRAYKAMNHMGDQLNEMDCLSKRDEKIFPIWDEVRAALSETAQDTKP